MWPRLPLTWSCTGERQPRGVVCGRRSCTHITLGYDRRCTVRNDRVTGYHGQHCDEMEVVGGKASPFWKAQGWRYATWRTGACPAAFNVNNKVESMFMGYPVTYIIKGIHTTKTHAPDAAGSSLSMLSLVPATRLRGAASSRS